jgi:hypothetical protein
MDPPIKSAEEDEIGSIRCVRAEALSTRRDSELIL